jgi:hypothetical protein
LRIAAALLITVLSLIVGEKEKIVDPDAIEGYVAEKVSTWEASGGEADGPLKVVPRPRFEAA